jgi:hypothetical protein
MLANKDMQAMVRDKMQEVIDLERDALFGYVSNSPEYNDGLLEAYQTCFNLLHELLKELECYDEE